MMVLWQNEVFEKDGDVAQSLGCGEEVHSQQSGEAC